MPDPRPPTPEPLYCPACDPVREHPQPMMDADGHWICGACYFKDGRIVEMQPRSEEPTE